jgi:MoaA/NifB/PqqE/SkfB family radical SAM enzyme
MKKSGARSRAAQKIVEKAFTASTPQLARMAKSPLVRKIITREVHKFLSNMLRTSRTDPDKLPSVQDDLASMGLAITGSITRVLGQNRLSDAYLRGTLQVLIKTLFIDRINGTQRQKYQEAFGRLGPSFLLISPCKACNLRCTGCYADSDDKRNALEWSLVDRIIEEAKDLWGERFFIISGGEPFCYRSEGKGLVDLFDKHQDSFFMIYTNGTLITDDVSRHLSQAGNALLCLSLEGFRERTDTRRGPGVFDTVVETMDRLNRDQVPFGMSLTATRENAEEILSDEFVDFMIAKGALLAFLFQYMPIGRSFTLDLMPTPEQRAWMWKRSWQVVRERQLFMPDFWNHGSCVDGCIAAGGHGQGGYFYIDWNGAVTPCVFMPYSPVNIRDIYAQGKTLNDVWHEPFFQAVRQWQYNYSQDRRSLISPCPSRDHHDELERLLMEYEPEPTDTNAADALVDPDYTSGLVVYNKRFEAITGGIWEDHYLRRKAAKDELIAPLPDIPPAP